MIKSYSSCSLLNYAIFAVILFLTGCSGDEDSSGTGTPASQSTTYTLFNLESAKSGESLSFDITGNDTDGNSFTGIFFFADGGQTTFNNATVIQTDILITATVNNAAVVTTSVVQYSDPITRALLAFDDGRFCTATVVAALPATAELGDFGSLGTRTCDDGSTEYANWFLVASTGGNAELTFSFYEEDQFCNLESDEEQTFTIDTNGNVISYNATVREAGGYVLTFGGS